MKVFQRIDALPRLSEEERLMRDAKITQIWEGTNQIHRQLIGRGFVAK